MKRRRLNGRTHPRRCFTLAKWTGRVSQTWLFTLIGDSLARTIDRRTFVSLMGDRLLTRALIEVRSVLVTQPHQLTFSFCRINCITRIIASISMWLHDIAVEDSESHEHSAWLKQAVRFNQPESFQCYTEHLEIGLFQIMNGTNEYWWGPSRPGCVMIIDTDLAEGSLLLNLLIMGWSGSITSGLRYNDHFDILISKYIFWTLEIWVCHIIWITFGILVYILHLILKFYCILLCEWHLASFVDSIWHCMWETFSISCGKHSPVITTLFEWHLPLFTTK